MRRTAVTATAIAASVCMISACGSSHREVAHPTTNVASRSEEVASGSVSHSARPERVLSLSGLGTLEGSCPPGARLWTLRFVSDPEASELVSYRVGTGARHTVNASAITIHLVPNATKTHEPADPFVPPAGQPRGVLKAMSLPTTAPIQALIYQATEPQTLQADVRLALASIGGESGQCVLAGSTVNAYTYLNGSP